MPYIYDVTYQSDSRCRGAMILADDVEQAIKKLKREVRKEREQLQRIEDCKQVNGIEVTIV